MSVPDNSGQIQTNGTTRPQKAVTGAGEMKQFPIAGQIAADQYAHAAAAAATPNRGIRFGKFIPAGPMPDNQATGLGGLDRFSGGGLV
jgi:hypothetical protein